MSNYEKCLSGIPHIEEESWEFSHCTENEHGLTHLNMYNPVPSVRLIRLLSSGLRLPTQST